MKGIVAALCAVALLSQLTLTGCDEERFVVPKTKRAKRKEYKKRMLAAPMAPLPRKRPQKQPKALTKKLTMTTTDGPLGRITSFAVAPSGLFALGGDQSRRILRWSLPKAKHTHTWGGLKGNARAIDISATGRRVLVLEGTQTLSLWSSEGRLLKRTPVQQPLTTARFTPLGNQIVGLTETGALLTFDSTQLKLRREQPICPDKRAGLSLDIDPLQRWIGVGCRSGHLWLGPFAQGGKLYHIGSQVTAVALAPKETLVAIGTETGALALWRLDLKKKSFARVTQIQGHIRPVHTLRFAEDGKRFASGSLDRHVGIWQLKKDNLTLQKRLAQTGDVTGIAWIPEHPKQIAITDSQGHLRLWRTTGTKLFVRSPASIAGGLVSFNERRGWLASHGDKGFALWDMRDGKRILASNVHPHPLLYLNVAIDGNHMLAVDRDNAVFWDLFHRRYIDVINPPKGTQISAACLGKEWTEVWFGTPRDGVYLWTIAGKRLLYRHTTPQYVSAVAFHPRRLRAVAVTLHGKIYYYDMKTRRLLGHQTLPSSKDPITHARFTPKGDKLLLLRGKRLLLLPWRKAKGRVLTHHSTLTAAHFLPKGELLLGSQDQHLYRWQPNDTKANTLTKGVKVCDSAVKDITSPRSQRQKLIAIACESGGAKLLHASTHKLISVHIPLSGKEWISATPNHHFTASSHALDAVYLFDGRQRLPIRTFQGWLFSPKRLKQRLRQAFQ